MTQQQQFAFMQSQAAHIEPEMRMIQHGHIQYPMLVGISREANPHADSILYYSYDGTGQMTDLANRGNDLPLVQSQMEQHEVAIRRQGLAYDWSDFEIGRAMLLNQSLSDRKVRIAFRIAEEEKERVFLEGDELYKWDGMVNHKSIPQTVAPQTWANATYTQIFDMVNDLISLRFAATNQVRICDTLLLPVAQFNYLNKPMGDDANRSIREYLAQNNAYTATTGRPLMIRTLRQLTNAGGTAGDRNAKSTNRAIAYPRDMEVIRFHVPQELTFIEPQRRGFSWIYHGAMVLAGLEIMEPNAMAYLDGI